MKDQHVKIDTRSVRGRILLAALLIAVALLLWFSARWQIGNMLGELTAPSAPQAANAAEIARRLAPRDPLPLWLAATKQKEVFQPDNFDRTVGMFEDVVRLSPYDFRWWIELGRQYEQAERFAEAERAFTRAVELAPEYTFPHWQLGNFYLRQDRPDAAFAELRKTTEKSHAYREQVFALAWDYYEQDASMVEAVAADLPDVRVTLAGFFVQRGKPENALRVWNTLSEEQKERNGQTARWIAHGLHDRHHFRQALAFSRDADIDPRSQFETVTNAGFEEYIGPPEETLFGWRVYRGERGLDVMTDSVVKTEGLRSLRVTFRNYQKPELYNTAQFIAVEPGRKYRLTFMLRTENLRSGGPPQLLVMNARDSSAIGASEPFPSGSADWQRMTVDFTVPGDSDGITLITRRVPCGEDCPVTGTFWYDDFVLSPL